MSLFVPPLQSAAILIPTVMAQDTLTVWTYRHDWSAWNLKVMLPGMAIGIFIGTLLAAALQPVHIRLAIGLIAAAFVLRQWLGQRFERLASRSNAATGVAFASGGSPAARQCRRAGPRCLPRKENCYAGTSSMLRCVSN
jgi:uncharacterized membrane protein YfcA